jgi:hypothetical protein
MSDILWRDDSGNVALWMMNGATAASAYGLGNLDPSSWSIAGQRDRNGDGMADILWLSAIYGVDHLYRDLAIWLMNGATILPDVGFELRGTWAIVGTGDFNGDGKSDILWRDRGGNVSIWLTDVSGSLVVNVPVAWTIVANADFDGDGKADILWQDDVGNTAIWFMNGTQISSGVNVGNIPAVWSVVGTGDFNGDGKSDIVWRDTSGNTAVWLMNGAAVASAGGLGNIPTTWSIVQTGDYNGDGMSDLLWRATRRYPLALDGGDLCKPEGDADDTHCLADAAIE